MGIIPDDGRMKPILIIPPETIDAEGVQLLRDNGLCVVVAKDPDAVKFLDPIPTMVDRSRVEQASIDLSRKLLSKDSFPSNGLGTRADVCRLFVDLLLAGVPLDPSQSDVPHVRSTGRKK